MELKKVNEIVETLLSNGVSEENFRIDEHNAQNFLSRPNCLIFLQQGRGLLLFLIHEETVTIRSYHDMDNATPYWEKKELSHEDVMNQIPTLAIRPHSDTMENLDYKYVRDDKDSLLGFNNGHEKMVKSVFMDLVKV